MDMLLKLARADIAGSAPRGRRITEESWRTLKGRVGEIRAEDAVERRESPLDRNDLMEMFGRPPEPWIKVSITRLENDAIEGRLGKDDTKKARENSLKPT